MDQSVRAPEPAATAATDAPDPADTLPPLPDGLLGRVIGNRYRLRSLLGHGGMADVYRAHDEKLRRDVAVKIFRPGTNAAGDRARFRSEVHTLAGLSHPSLVALFDSGQDESRPWCAMQLVEGGTLADLAAPASPQRVARIGEQIADALAHVHALGIVHRDVKPSNILIDTDARAYLSDFGVAQIVDATRMTSSGDLLGTAAYLSPEQVLGAPATPAVDVYALALVLLESLTGRREYPGGPVESAVARLSRAPQVPDDLGPRWTSLLTAMTALDPRARPDAVTVRLRLREVTRQVPPMPVTDPVQVVPLPARPAPSPLRRALAAALAHRAALASTAAAVLAVGIGISVLASGGEPSTGRIDPAAVSAPRTSPSLTSPGPVPGPGNGGPVTGTGAPTPGIAAGTTAGSVFDPPLSTASADGPFGTATAGAPPSTTPLGTSSPSLSAHVPAPTSSPSPAVTSPAPSGSPSASPTASATHAPTPSASSSDGPPVSPRPSTSAEPSSTPSVPASVPAVASA